MICRFVHHLFLFLKSRAKRAYLSRQAQSCRDDLWPVQTPMVKACVCCGTTIEDEAKGPKRAAWAVAKLQPRTWVRSNSPPDRHDRIVQAFQSLELCCNCCHERTQEAHSLTNLAQKLLPLAGRPATRRGHCKHDDWVKTFLLRLGTLTF